MSGNARPEMAFSELERLVRSLGEELAFFRRRALEAERRWRDAMEHTGHGDTAPTRESLASRLAELERENGELRARLDDAAERTRQMAERLRFLRQQEGGAGER
ncbi:hypothetical protein J421_3443 [Gemmatirosa kalamazoonensis]|uniref:Uncharacterized protein n=2 Tax=Gemmatirosa kalamazoonensis TaxID=861299 RepID=W0RKX3_9BACT|nr:hypothetical protein J421_3443 [Gemmatirosa kalamazoonensis]